ncbi:hypothetical protein ES706_03516 [subsurface metagenome]
MSMNESQIYIVIALVALAIIAMLLIFMNKSKKQKRLSKLAGLALLFVISGIVFGDDRLIGYSLIGVGVLLAVIDIINNLKNR